MNKQKKKGSNELKASDLKFINYSGFHQTTLSIKEVYKMLSILILSMLGYYLTIATGLEFLLKNQKITVISNTLINFLIMEVLPLITFGLIIQWLYYRKTNKNLFSVFKRWFLYLKNDFKNHIFTIISFSLLLLVVNPIINFAFSYLFPATQVQNVTTKAVTTSLPYFIENLVLVFAVAFISPVIEEFIFRLCLSEVFLNLFSKLFGKYFKKTQTRVAYVFSALFFASVHLGGSATFSQMVMFVFAGLVLQYLRNKTNSLTASILTHMSYNLVTSFLLLV